MDESNSAEHLNSSLTDLMTSLMVIFILLLLVGRLALGRIDVLLACCSRRQQAAAHRGHDASKLATHDFHPFQSFR